MIRLILLTLFIVRIIFWQLQLQSQQLPEKDYDAPQAKIISRYLVFGDNVAQRGKVHFFDMGNPFLYHRFVLWASSQGLLVSTDQPPFVNNRLQILGEEGAKLLLEPVDLGMENYLCFDFAQLKIRPDRPSLPSWQGELSIRVSGKTALRLTMPVKHFFETPCINLNSYTLPEKKIVIELVPNYGQGSFWGIYDLYLLHRLDYNPWPRMEKFSGWPLNLQ